MAVPSGVVGIQEDLLVAGRESWECGLDACDVGDVEGERGGGVRPGSPPGVPADTLAVRAASSNPLVSKS